jgi:hypothetical protein
MSRHSLSKLLAFWTRSRPGRPSTGAPAWPEIPVRMSMEPPSTVRAPFTAEQLDDLCGMLLPGPDDARTDRPSRPSRGDGGSARRQAPSLNVVDRAIAEIANPRGRRKRARW